MKSTLFIAGFIILWFFVACSTKKDEGLIISDGTLFNIAVNNTSFTYYKNRTDTLLSDPSSPHGGYMRVRFNQKAMTVMNDSVSRLTSTSFPEGSMVVKEIYDHPGGPLLELDIIYKAADASNSSGGWVWNEMHPDGSIEYSASNKGNECTSCHHNSDNLDYVRVFFTH